MKQKIIGFRKLDFKSGDGSQVKGTQLFTSFPEEGVIGEMTEKIFLHDDFAVPDCKPGDVLDITYDRKGKPVTITLIGK